MKTSIDFYMAFPVLTQVWKILMIPCFMEQFLADFGLVWWCITQQWLVSIGKMEYKLHTIFTYNPGKGEDSHYKFPEVTDITKVLSL